MILEIYNRAEEIALENDKKHYLELLKCLYTYRVYPSIDTLLFHKKELVYQLDHIYSLWRKFDGMSQAELADFAIELIHKIWT